MKHSTWLLVCVLTILQVHGHSVGAEAPAAVAPVRVACLGDSITYGARVKENRQTQSYPAQLQRLLGGGYEVRNFGIGSATLIKVGRPNVWQAMAKVKTFDPHVVVISLGTNDTVGGKPRRNWERIGTFDADCRELIDTLAAGAARPRILLCTPTPMVLETEGLSASRLAGLKERKPRLQELCKRLRAIAKESADRQVTLVELNPLLEGRPDLIYKGDGVHPNAAGYLRVAEHVCTAVTAPHHDRWSGRKADWKGFDQYHFTVDGRKAYVVVPKRPAAGRPWIWRARFPTYHAEMDITLLGKGYHVAYVDVAGLFGAPKAISHGDKLYEMLTTRHGLSRKPVLEGVSRGGLFVYNWAARNPRKVACIYCDTPVCDFKSWPAGKGTGVGSAPTWAKCLKVYGLTEEQALAYDENPVDHAATIAAAKIPLLHIVSENDRVVPPAENTYLLKSRIEKLGGKMGVISVQEGTAKSKGHHFTHPDPQRVVDFILKHTGAANSD